MSPGELVSGYRVERVLGSGGMGTVYLVNNPVLPRHDALKVLSPELSRDRAFRARFTREADLAATLDHPNIVAVYNRGETDNGHLWIAMQYVSGSDAESEVDQGRMPPERAVYIVGEVAKALDYLHRRNLVHRDVKPANFLVSRDDHRTFLADFGIARAIDDAVSLTSTGMVVATIAYAAPEAFSGDYIVDGRADIYSLGCSLYQMLTGNTPFSDLGSMSAVVAAHLSKQPPKPTDVVPSLPSAIDIVIATAMAKQPERRYRSAHEFAAAARAALEGGSAAPRPTAPWNSANGLPAPVRSSWWRRPAWVALAIAAVILMTVGVATTGFLLIRGNQHNDEDRPIYQESIAPNFALMDVGDYSIAPRSADFTTPSAASLLKAYELAEYVIGPWEIEKQLTSFGYDSLSSIIINPDNDVVGMIQLPDWQLHPHLDEILVGYDLIAGFSSPRFTSSPTPMMKLTSLRNMVFEFPSIESAEAAAVEMATTAVSDPVAPSGAMTSISIDGLPQTNVQVQTRTNDGTVNLAAYTPYGRYVLYQMGTVQTDEMNPYANARIAIKSIVLKQKSRLDKFKPKDTNDVQELLHGAPVEMLSRTLTALDGNLPGLATGVWKPDAWLHYEPDPAAMRSVFKAANVEWVTQVLTTVYRAEEKSGAEMIFDKLNKVISGIPGVERIDPPPGLPAARCFERTIGADSASRPMSSQMIWWRFKCISHTEQYAASAFSQTEDDVKQQISAQYQLLASE